MYYWDYIYSKDSNCIISLDTSTEKFNKIPKGFLDIKIFALDGTPVENACIRIFAPDKYNKYILEINAIGYYPIQINNVRVCPGLLCKLNVNLNPIQIRDQFSNQNQAINPPLYENLQTIPDISELPQDTVRELSLTLGMDSPKDTLTYLYGEKFADEVYALSNGKIKIEVFTDGKLGADRQMIKTILQNDYPTFIVQTTAHQVDFVPNLSVFDMPMVYNNIENLRNTIDNDLFYDKISSSYGDAGYKLLGMADILFRQMTSNKEIQNIDDFKGIKIRTIQNHNHQAFWELLGATVIPLPSNLIYTDLNIGTIDAQENPYEVIVGFKFYEVQDYLIDTCHLPHLLPLITSNNFYNNLTLAEKEIIDEAALRATAYAREKADERFEERKKILIDNGMTIVDLSKETILEMRSAALPIYDKIREMVGDDDLIDFYYQNSNLI